jgi:hypothetical protein
MSCQFDNHANCHAVFLSHVTSLLDRDAFYLVQNLVMRGRDHALVMRTRQFLYGFLC